MTQKNDFYYIEDKNNDYLKLLPDCIDSRGANYNICTYQDGQDERENRLITKNNCRCADCSICGQIHVGRRCDPKDAGAYKRYIR